MSKILFSFLMMTLLITNIADAKQPGCREFVVTITNKSPNDCILKTQHLLTGTMFQGSQIPDLLLQGQSTQFVLTTDFKSVALAYVKYQCGQNSIDLLSSDPFFDSLIMLNVPPVEGFVLNKDNMNASFTSIPPSMCNVWYDTPAAEINWTIY
ncbi:MAG: hypothetical protein CK424_06570 [Legionella sp.]|nr:MAG: hypothetical protein CK424_06570 [Legionella sp.]